MQIDVEADEIQVLRAEEFRWREICERAEAIRIERLGLGNEFINELRNRLGAAPPHHVGGNLIRHAERKHRRMLCTTDDRAPHRFPRRLALRQVVEKTEVLVPRNVHEKFEIVLLRKVENPFRRDVIDADDIRAKFADEREILRGLINGRPWLTGRIGREGAVGNALHEELGLAQPEEFAIHADAWSALTRRTHALWT